MRSITRRCIKEDKQFMTKRDTYIDLLRFIGVTLVILAHVKTPILIHSLRCFDVPLMVFISGLSYGGKTVNSSLKHYYLSRTKRLIVPVYVFLTIYFTLLYLLGNDQSLTTIIASYALLNTGSIGYVWIIKVFLLIMLVTPLLLKCSKRLTLSLLWILIFIMLICNEIICISIIPVINVSRFKFVFIEIVPYIIGYSAVFLLGSKLRYSNREDENVSIFILLFLEFLLCSIYYISNQSFNIQYYKYPPQSFFIIYGMLISVILWRLRNQNFLRRISQSRAILFIGRNTIWIYLWHIIYIIFANKFISNWIGQYIFIYLTSIFSFYVQYRIILKLINRYQWSFLKYFIG